MESFEFISDLYKDARGFRPSTSFMRAFDAQTTEEKQAQWDSLCDDLAQREAEEQSYQRAAQRDFETRIGGMVADYGITRGTAMRWDLDSFDTDIAGALAYHGSAIQEIEHYLYKQGLAFSLFPMYVAEIAAEFGLSEFAT